MGTLSLDHHETASFFDPQTERDRAGQDVRRRSQAGAVMMGPGWLGPRGNENTARSDLLAAVGGQPWSPLSGGLAQPLDMDTDPTR